MHNTYTYTHEHEHYIIMLMTLSVFANMLFMFNSYNKYNNV